MSERDLTAGMAAAVAAGTVRPVLFYEGEFYSGGVAVYLRLWSGLGNFSWNGFTWLGAGQLLGMTAPEESGEVRAQTFQISLSGQPAALISSALQSVRPNRPGKVWLGCFDAAGVLIADPYPVRRGLLSKPLIDDSGETCTITIEYLDRRAALEVPRERRYTSEDQQIDFPFDKGFDQVEALQDVQLKWPPT